MEKPIRVRQDPKFTVNTSCPMYGNFLNINALALQVLECDMDWKSIHTREIYSENLLTTEVLITDISKAFLLSPL
jgi:hypothetical protein